MRRILKPADVIHPLRKEYVDGVLPEEMQKRCIEALQSLNAELATSDEIDAYVDLIHDSITMKKQTHLGVTTEQ